MDVYCINIYIQRPDVGVKKNDDQIGIVFGATNDTKHNTTQYTFKDGLQERNQQLNYTGAKIR